jgi:maleate cis-trans isomerase
MERTRIGIITPDDAVNDDEYWEYVNTDVTLMVDRFRTPARFDSISPDMVATYGDLSLLADSAETLRITRPHAIAFFCNSCSFVKGPGADLEICRRISESGGAPATTTSTAQVAALRQLGVRRVAIGAPYGGDVTSRLGLFLEGHGFEVVSQHSLGLLAEWDIGNAAPAVWYDLTKQIDRPEAECLLLACTGIRTAPILSRLEQECGKPVISAPAVTIWHSLRLAGYSRPVENRGMLLECHLECGSRK